MEHVKIERNAEKYDRAVHGDGHVPVLRDAGELAVYVKQNGTNSGRSVAVITFAVAMPDGTIARAQSVTTLQNLAGIATICQQWCAEDDAPRSSMN